MCCTIWVDTRAYIHAHTCPCVGVWPCTCVHAEHWTRILLETLAVVPAANSLLYTQGCVLLTSLTTSEGKDEGFRSPRNALVLPNELETKVRPGGLSGREVQPEPCAGSRGDEETIYWAPAQGWTARPLNWEADNLFIKAVMGPHYPNWLLALIHSQFKVCLVLSHEYNGPLMRDTGRDEKVRMNTFLACCQCLKTGTNTHCGWGCWDGFFWVASFGI